MTGCTLCRKRVSLVDKYTPECLHMVHGGCVVKAFNKERRRCTRCKRPPGEEVEVVVGCPLCDTDYDEEEAVKVDGYKPTFPPPGLPPPPPPSAASNPPSGKQGQGKKKGRRRRR